MSSTNLLIPDVIPGQDNKTVTINEAWDLLDLKITGDYVQDFASDANETPSAGEVAEWRKASKINVSSVFGSLTVARSLLLDDTAVGFYVIRDDTAGGQDVTFTTVTGAGIVLSKNWYKLCYHDGTDILEIALLLPQDARVALTPAATVDIDFSLPGPQTLTLDQNTALTFSNLEVGATVIAEIQSGTTETLTFPGGGDTRLLANASFIADGTVNIISFYCNDKDTPEVLVTIAT